MIKFSLAGLKELGFDRYAGLHYDGAAYEVRHRKVRTDAISVISTSARTDPVFRCDELGELPDEY